MRSHLHHPHLLDLLVRHLPLALLLSLLAIVVEFATLMHDIYHELFIFNLMDAQHELISSQDQHTKKVQAKTNFIGIHFRNLVVKYLQLLPMVSHFLQVFRLKLMQRLQIVLKGGKFVKLVSDKENICMTKKSFHLLDIVIKGIFKISHLFQGFPTLHKGMGKYRPGIYSAIRKQKIL